MTTQQGAVDDKVIATVKASAYAAVSPKTPLEVKKFIPSRLESCIPTHKQPGYRAVDTSPQLEWTYRRVIGNIVRQSNREGQVQIDVDKSCGC
jgi:hypothetical protein